MPLAFFAERRAAFGRRHVSRKFAEFESLLARHH
jgi:hypothetical protein